MQWRRSEASDGVVIESTPKGLPLRERFYRHTKRDQMSGCLLWTASLNSGYGQFAVRSAHDGPRLMLAHRVAWYIEHDALPEGELHHLCHTPTCVEVRHLVDLGSHDHHSLAHGFERRQERERADAATSPEMRLIERLRQLD